MRPFINFIHRSNLHKLYFNSFSKGSSKRNGSDNNKQIDLEKNDAQILAGKAKFDLTLKQDQQDHKNWKSLAIGNVFLSSWIPFYEQVSLALVLINLGLIMHHRGSRLKEILIQMNNNQTKKEEIMLNFPIKAQRRRHALLIVTNVFQAATLNLEVYQINYLILMISIGCT